MKEHLGGTPLHEKVSSMVGERALALSCSPPERHDSKGHAFDKCVSQMTITKLWIRMPVS